MSYNPSPADVKKLREHTGAGMGDCKKALLAVAGDFEEAVLWLRKHNLAVAGKRCDRAANEGRVFVCVGDQYAGILELSCETDFVAMTDDMARLGDKLVQDLACSGATTLSAEQQEVVKEVAATLKENVGVRRVHTWTIGPSEWVGEYLHSKKNLGVLVKANCNCVEEKKSSRIKEVLKDLAMHVAAYAPIFLSRDKVDQSFLEEQRKIAEGQAQELKGKPEQVIEKILKGKIDKQVANVCLMDQAFVKNDALSVQEYLKQISKELGVDLQLTDFVYMKVGQ